ncbi:WYL domain-containing protein [Rothia nasisuis]|uniref:WYL domain-containing protein n=1 Tax=Rothia nasisuis TaxID=2109647 RepID=UPI003AFA3A02
MAVPKSLPAAHRERTQAALIRYATASAEETHWVFYRLPLAHTSWALSLLIELGPTVRVLEPQALCLELLSLLRASPTANSQ